MFDSVRNLPLQIKVCIYLRNLTISPFSDINITDSTVKLPRRLDPSEEYIFKQHHMNTSTAQDFKLWLLTKFLLYKYTLQIKDFYNIIEYSRLANIKSFKILAQNGEEVKCVVNESVLHYSLERKKTMFQLTMLINTKHYKNEQKLSYKESLLCTVGGVLESLNRILQFPS